MPDQKVDAYMPLWIGEYLADTMGFKALQHGAYLLLLMAYWRSRAPLPDDDDELAGIARVTAAEWKAIRPKLERKFQVADGLWKHKRCERELADAQARKQKASSKAKKGAQARWGGGPGQCQDDAPSIAQALLATCPTTSTSPSPSESSEAIASAAAAAPASVDNPKTEDPPPAPAAVDRRAAWRGCGQWMLANGVAESTARELMGALLRDYSDVALDAMVQAPKQESTPDPKAYLIATAKRLRGERATVPSQDAEKTAELLERMRKPSPEEWAASEAARQRVMAGRTAGATG